MAKGSKAKAEKGMPALDGAAAKPARKTAAKSTAAAPAKTGGHLKRTPEFEAGLAVRHKVLGAAYVEPSVARGDADPFTAMLQQFVTEYCWGGVWLREGLDWKTRSIMNLTMLSALGRATELALHVRGALNNGVTREEIGEVFLHVGTYAGVPAAVEAFRVANEVFAKYDAEKA